MYFQYDKHTERVLKTEFEIRLTYIRMYIFLGLKDFSSDYI